MKLIRFSPQPSATLRPGVLRENTVVDLAPRFSSIAAFLHAYPAGWTPEDLDTDGLDEYPLESIVLGPPLDEHSLVYAVAANYQQHADESGLDVPAHPLLFIKPYTSLVGGGAPIRVPAISQKMDFEGELGVVIGKRATRVSAGEARNYVAGYTIINDVTARDLQWTQLGNHTIVDWLSSKNLDDSSPTGPAITSAKKIDDPHNLQLKTTLNDDVMQDGNTSLMVFSIWEIMAYLTQRVTLRPGDIIATGTPVGVGGVRDIFLQPGDVVRVRIDHVGTLENPVVMAV